MKRNEKEIEKKRKEKEKRQSGTKMKDDKSVIRKKKEIS